MLDVILPAGGRLLDAGAAACPDCPKALLKVCGDTLLERALVALRGVEGVRRIAVIGDEQVQHHALQAGADFALPKRASAPQNVAAGLEALLRAKGGGPARILLVATDLPLITTGSLQAFLNRCEGEFDVWAPVVNRTAFEQRFPAAPATFLRLREGEVTLGCAALARAEALPAMIARAEALFGARKSNLSMARLLGARVLIAYACRRLTLAQVARRVGQMLQVRGSAVIDAPPELAFDVDDASDLRAAQDILHDPVVLP